MEYFRENKIKICLIIVISIIAMFGIAVFSSPKIDINNIKSAELTFDHDNIPINQELSKSDIKDILDIINSKKEHWTRNSWSNDFLFKIYFKNGGFKEYGIDFREDKSIMIIEYVPSKEYEGVKDSIRADLTDEYVKKAFDLPAFKKFYESSHPIFPTVYSEGIHLLGSNYTDNWQYQNFDKNWRNSDKVDTKQEKQYTLKGNTLNVLFPRNPKKKEYAIYNQDGKLIEKNEMKTHKIQLPKQKGSYKIELTGSWDIDDTIYPDEGLESGLPNSFKGDTKTTVWVSAYTAPSKIEKALDVSNHIPLISVEDVLKDLNSQYFIDYNKNSCKINSFDNKNEKSVNILDKKEGELKNLKTFDMNIKGLDFKRTVYMIDKKAYINASSFAYDLGMVLKKNKNNQYVYSNNDVIYPVRIPNKIRYGYVNKDGKWVIPPILKNAEDFDGDYAIFSINGEAASPDEIQIQGAEFSQFSESLQKDLIDIYTPEVDGMIDKKGNIIIQPGKQDFYYQGNNVIRSFKAVNTTDEIVYYLLDEKKYIALPELGNILYMGRLSEGLVPICIRKNPDSCGRYDDKYCYINLKGEVVIPSQFTNARAFVNGRAIVGRGPYIEHERESKLGIIDKKGSFKVPYIFDYIYNYNENVACVCLKTNGKNQFAYIDTEGNLLTGLDYKLANNFSNGRALVNIDDENLSYIDKDFKFVKNSKGDLISKIKKLNVKPIDEYDYFYYSGSLDSYQKYKFSENYVIFNNKKRFDYMDTMGNHITNGKFKLAEPFKNGMAKIGIDEDEHKEQHSYVDTLGNIVKIQDYE